MDPQMIGGRYELQRRIGVGGMARVYLARDRLLGRDVAVKVLNAENASDPLFVERFRREAQAAAALNHPNIVSIYDTGFSEDSHGDFVYYIVMEYVPGPNLKDRVAAQGPLPEAEALRVAESIAAALEPAHRRGIVHRDVKPHNVILDPDGQVKVADFGIARAEGLSQLTKTNAVTGTVHYVSPEQAQRRPVDGRSDLYSLGVVLYELLTGALPFEGESQVEIALQHVNDQPRSPREINGSISPLTESVVMRALAKDPAARFQSAGEMRQALGRARASLAAPRRAAIATAGATAGSHEPTQRALTPIDRPPVQLNPAPPSRQTAVPQRNGSQVGGRKDAWILAIPALLALLVAGGLVVAHPWTSPHRLGPQAAGARVTATPRRSSPTHTASARKPSPRPARTASLPAVPAPTAMVVDTSTPTNASAAPPPTATPGSEVPSVASSSAGGSPAEAVQTFYSLVASGQLDQAAGLWDQNMRRSCPPSQCIYGRFGHSQISLSRAQVVSRSESQAKVAVVVAEVQGSSTITWGGNWYLVHTPSGWRLDAEDLRQL